MQAANLYPTDPRTGASVLYKNETVEVTPTILTILGTASTRMTYAVRNITSIGIKREEPNVIFPVLLILAGLFMVIAALQMTNVASALALIGVGLGVALSSMWKRTGSAISAPAESMAERRPASDLQRQRPRLRAGQSRFCARSNRRGRRRRLPAAVAICPQ